VPSTPSGPDESKTLALLDAPPKRRGVRPPPQHLLIS